MPTDDRIDPVAMNRTLTEVRRRGRLRLRRRRTLAGVVVAAVAAVTVPATLLTTGGGRVRVDVGMTGSPKTTSAPAPSVIVPLRYPGTNTAVPPALRRPLHLPVLRPGQSCPATAGQRFDQPDFGGIALGTGLVRMIIANRFDLARRQVDLGGTVVPGWLALQTLWFASPRYHGPFVVRGERIGAPGVLDTGGGQAPIAAPLLVPAGPTANTFHGYRTVPDGSWVTHPGCYAMQVDGLTFSEIIVVDMRSGIIAGTLRAVGGPSPGPRRPLPGSITIRSSGLGTETITVGADGTFSIPVVAGTYTITGRSPLYQRGKVDCGPADPVVVATGATQRVNVVCAEK